jgi:hypothetical protein
MVQPAWGETVEPVSASRARAREREHARERMVHAVGLILIPRPLAAGSFIPPAHLSRFLKSGPPEGPPEAMITTSP